LGHADPVAALPHVGALVEGPGFHGFLSGRDNLLRVAAAEPLLASRDIAATVSTALERVGLAAAADRRYRGYSLGMKQRLGLAAALLGPRELLVLDEPTNGLDPQGTREVRSLIRSLAAEGTTVFLSSHLLSEIEQVCTHVAVMRSGRLVTSGTLDDLRAESAPRVRVRTPDAEAAASTLQRLGMVVERTSADELDAALPAHTAVEAVTSALVADGVRVRGIAVTGASLEERFVELTGEGFDVDG
jgi:ABC-2 type transport system ATP-binding protein